MAVVTTPARPPRKATRWSESPIFVLLLLPAVVFLAFTSVYPLARTLWLSFHTWFMNQPNTSPQWVGLGEYQATLADEVFRTSALNTALFGVGTVAVELLLGLALALALTGGGGGIRVARSILLVPMIMTPVVVGVLWRILLFDKGLVNYLLVVDRLGAGALVRRSQLGVRRGDAGRYLDVDAVRDDRPHGRPGVVAGGAVPGRRGSMAPRAGRSSASSRCRC